MANVTTSIDIKGDEQIDAYEYRTFSAVSINYGEVHITFENIAKAQNFAWELLQAIQNAKKEEV